MEKLVSKCLCHFLKIAINSIQELKTMISSLEITESPNEGNPSLAFLGGWRFYPSAVCHSSNLTLLLSVLAPHISSQPLRPGRALEVPGLVVVDAKRGGRKQPTEHRGAPAARVHTQDAGEERACHQRHLAASSKPRSPGSRKVRFWHLETPVVTKAALPRRAEHGQNNSFLKFFFP